MDGEARRSTFGAGRWAPGPYRYRVYGSIDQIPEGDWCPPSQEGAGLFMDRRLIAAVEASLGPEGTRLWHLIFYGGGEVPVAWASLCLYRLDLTLLASPMLKRVTGWVRRSLPAFGRVGVLFCGLPVSIGERSLVFADGCDQEAVLGALARLMEDIAVREQASILVFKEFTDEEGRAMEPLLERGYLRAETPCMHTLACRSPSLAAYCASLRAHYRYDIKRSQHKYAAAGLTSVRLRQGADIARAYSDEIHRLYEAVVARAQSRLEVLPPSFFRELALRFSGGASLTLLKKDDRVVAFNYSLLARDCYYFLFCGIDDSFRSEADLYFNLMYRDLDHGLQEKRHRIQLGQSSDQFKARLGARATRRFAYVRGRGWLGWLLRAGRTWLLPTRPAAPSFDVFKKTAMTE